MKKLVLVAFSILMYSTSFSQSDIIKVNLSTHIKTGLLAPSSFKIHRFECTQISLPAQKLLSDLKKKMADVIKEQKSVMQHLVTLRINSSNLKQISDSLLELVKLSPNNIQRNNIAKKRAELKTEIPKDQEYILWMARIGKDTTKAHLAYSYSLEIQKIPLEPIEQKYWESKKQIEQIKDELNSFDKQLSLLLTKGNLITIYEDNCSKDLPIYSTYIVYQALTKGGSNNLFEETYYFNKDYKCLGTDYDTFWTSLDILN